MTCCFCVIVYSTQRGYDTDSAKMYLFVVCWSQGQIVQAVWGHIPNSIKEPEVGDRLHAQLSRQEIRKKIHYWYTMFTQLHQIL